MQQRKRKRRSPSLKKPRKATSMGAAKKGGEQGMYVAAAKKEDMVVVTVDAATKDVMRERRQWLHGCCQWLYWCVCSTFLLILRRMRTWWTCDKEDNRNFEVNKEENKDNINEDACCAEQMDARCVDAAIDDDIDVKSTNSTFKDVMYVDSSDADYKDTINKDANISENNVDIHRDAPNSVNKEDTDASLETNQGKDGVITQEEIRFKTFNRYDELTTIIETLLKQQKIKHVEKEFDALCKALDALNHVVDDEIVERNLIKSFAYVKEFMAECWKAMRGGKKVNTTDQKSLIRIGKKRNKYNEKMGASAGGPEDSKSNDQDPPASDSLKRKMPIEPDCGKAMRGGKKVNKTDQKSLKRTGKKRNKDKEKMGASAGGPEHSKLNDQDPPASDSLKNRMPIEPDRFLVEAAEVEYTQLDAYLLTDKEAPIPMSSMELDLVKTAVDRAVKGLRNLGNTCYMNSTLQCLNNTSPLEVIGRYQPMFAGYAQQDSHELLSCLMFGLHEGLNKVEQDNNGHSNEEPAQDNNEHSNEEPAQDNDGHSNEEPAEICWQEHKLHNQSILVELFHGQFKTTIRCNSCKKETAGFQIFMYLFLPIPETTDCTLDDCLKDFSKEMRITGDCLVHSSDCRNNSDTIMKQEICKLPHILIITLRRFANEGWRRIKINTDVHFETSAWNLSECVICPRSKTYNLYAVSNHYGTLEGGHYTACCKNPVNQKWYTFNDEHVSAISECQVKKNHTKAAYVLYYTSIDQQRYNPASALKSK